MNEIKEAPPLPNKSLNNEIIKKEEEEKLLNELSEFDYILSKIDKILQNHTYSSTVMHPERILGYFHIKNMIYEKKLGIKK